MVVVVGLGIFGCRSITEYYGTLRFDTNEGQYVGMTVCSCYSYSFTTCMTCSRNVLCIILKVSCIDEEAI